jgi:hypothetical protein
MLRRWISLLAVFGVLLHVGAVVRHNAVMANAYLQHQSLVADLQVICHSAGVGVLETADLPDVPRPTDTKLGCPLCASIASAFALPVPESAPLQVPLLASLASPQTAQAAAFQGLDGRCLPPVRGPPIIV